MKGLIEMLFKKRSTLEQEEAAAKQLDQSLDRMVERVQRQAGEVILDIREQRERKLLRGALGGD